MLSGYIIFVRRVLINVLIPSVNLLLSTVYKMTDKWSRNEENN
jgi:hypothetical protein